MYKISSDKRQTALHRGRLADWLGPGAPDLTDEQKRQTLVDRAQSIHDALVKLPKKSPERRALGLEYAEINLAINELRPARRGPPSVESFFICVAKERLTRVQYDQLMTEATARAESARQKERPAP